MKREVRRWRGELTFGHLWEMMLASGQQGLNFLVLPPCSSVYFSPAGCSHILLQVSEEVCLEVKSRRTQPWGSRASTRALLAYILGIPAWSESMYC